MQRRLDIPNIMPFRNRGRKLQLKTPHEALAEYVASYPSRVHMQERFMDETMKYAEVERRSMRPGLGRDFPMNWAVDA